MADCVFLLWRPKDRTGHQQFSSLTSSTHIVARGTLALAETCLILVDWLLAQVIEEFVPPIARINQITIPTNSYRGSHIRNLWAIGFQSLLARPTIINGYLPWPFLSYFALSILLHSWQHMDRACHVRWVACAWRSMQRPWQTLFVLHPCRMRKLELFEEDQGFEWHASMHQDSCPVFSLLNEMWILWKHWGITSIGWSGDMGILYEKYYCPVMLFINVILYR